MTLREINVLLKLVDEALANPSPAHSREALFLARASLRILQSDGRRRLKADTARQQ